MYPQGRNRFWVIFDTCTRREYYQDVHNLLALPRGAVLRYEFRERWLSRDAIEAASSAELAPLPVLLVYAQWKHYQKGNGTPTTPPPTDEVEWVPTRLAEMKLIPAPEGTNYFFDLAVMGYPRLDYTALSRILSPLREAQETPFHKWVSLSSNLDALSRLRQGGDDDNWQDIVDRLGAPPMQFAGDSFWRLKGPHHSARGRLVPPRYVRDRQRTAQGVVVRQITSLYPLLQGRSYAVEFISHSPSTQDVERDTPSTPARRVVTELSQTAPLELRRGSVIDARQYTGSSIEVYAKQSERLDEQRGSLRIRTEESDRWPTGANVELRIGVAKSTWEVIATAVLALLSVAVGVIAAASELALGVRVGLGVIAFCFLALATLLLTGKMPLKR